MVESEDLPLHIKEATAHRAKHFTWQFDKENVCVASVSLDFDEVVPEEVACAVLKGIVDARHSASELLRGKQLRRTCLASLLSNSLTTSRDGYRHGNVLPAFRKAFVFSSSSAFYFKSSTSGSAAEECDADVETENEERSRLER